MVASTAEGRPVNAATYVSGKVLLRVNLLKHFVNRLLSSHVPCAPALEKSSSIHVSPQHMHKITPSNHQTSTVLQSKMPPPISTMLQSKMLPPDQQRVATQNATTLMHLKTVMREACIHMYVRSYILYTVQCKFWKETGQALCLTRRRMSSQPWHQEDKSFLDLDYKENQSWFAAGAWYYCSDTQCHLVWIQT